MYSVNDNTRVVYEFFEKRYQKTLYRKKYQNIIYIISNKIGFCRRKI